MSNKPSRTIPAPIRRAVRKRYGFGCAICGLPIFDYDHFAEYAEVKEHSEDNIVILCPNHHSDKTRKRLSKNRINYYRENYRNKSEPYTAAWKIEPNESIEVIVGSNYAIWTPLEEDSYFEVIWVAGISHFTLHFEDGWITFSLHVTNSEGLTLLYIHKGEMVVSTDIGDYEYVADKLTISNEMREVVCELTLRNDKIVIHNANFITESIGWSIKDSAMTTIGTDAKLISLFGQAHWRGAGGGMCGIIDYSLHQPSATPTFGWAVSNTANPTAYIWVSDATFERLKDGEFPLISLEAHWRQNTGRPLSVAENFASKDIYFLDFYTNNRLAPSVPSHRLAVNKLHNFFEMLSAATEGD